MRLSGVSPKHIVVLCLLTGSLLIPSMAAASPTAAQRRAELQKRQTNISTKISAVRKQLHQTVSRERQKKSQLQRVEKRLITARHQLVEANKRLERTQAELNRASLALAEARHHFTATQQEAEDRLFAAYTRGRQGSLELLLTTEDFGQLLQRAHMIQYIVDEDRRSLEALHERQEKVAKYQEQVQNKHREVATVKQEVAVLHNLTDLERRRTANELSTEHKQRLALQKELDALERDSAAVSSMLRSLQSSAAGQRRYNTTYTGPVSGMPVPGRITSGFGYRIHPVYKTRRLHTGVDIAAPHGTPVRATGGGEVVSAGWRGGYGNTVIIDHGRGKATLYAHMSSISVSNGQRVSRNQVIGRVGSTGVSTGPHMHYEVRINGQPVNPL